MTRPVQMLLDRSYFMYQIVCITFAERTTIVKLKHLIIPTFQYTLLYDSEEGFNQHCFTDRLVWSPMQAQQPMDEMWGKSHEVKNIHAEDTRGHLFEWGTMPCLFTGDCIRTWPTSGRTALITALANG